MLNVSLFLVLMPYTDLQKLQKIERIIFRIQIKPSNGLVTLPEVDDYLLFIDFYLYYKYSASVISFT